MPTSDPTSVDFVALSAEVVSAHVAKNSVPVADLPALLGSVHAALVRIAAGAANPASQIPETLTPAVSLRRSVTPDYLICLDDGRKFKSLKRHLRQLGMTPDQYRVKWNLSSDYPMVAPNYAASRSALAKKIGLGQKRRKKA
jgi:predicted transcriptional regulator